MKTPIILLVALLCGVLGACNTESPKPTRTEQRIITKSYQRFVPITGVAVPMALDTKTGEECITRLIDTGIAPFTDMPFCGNLFISNPD